MIQQVRSETSAWNNELKKEELAACLKKRAEGTSKIYQVAITLLFTSSQILFCAILPTVCIVAWTCLNIGGIALSIWISKEIKKQEKFGFTKEKQEEALRSILALCKLKKVLRNYFLIVNISACIFSSISLFTLSLTTLLYIVDWTTYNQQKKEAKKGLRSLINERLCTKELHALQRQFPNIFVSHDDQTESLKNQRIELMNQEKEGRKIKKYYSRYLTTFILSSWIELVSRKLFQANQMYDWDIYEPLCKLAVVKEIQANKLFDSSLFPPTLQGRIKDLNQLKRRFRLLSKDDKEQVIQKQINPYFDINKHLIELAQKISTIGNHMLQGLSEQFETALSGANAKLLLKKCKLKKYSHVMFDTLEKFKDRLLFKATPILRFSQSRG